MLKLSTKGRYGIRAMIELADAYGEGPVMMSAISEKQEISRKYLHALLTSLKEAGLVRSVRGAKGGYLLMREPDEILLTEIFEALEGRVAVIDCLDASRRCDRSEHCLSRNVWSDLNDAIVSVLNGYTLGALARGERGPSAVEFDDRP
jgi:Rrf2 family transcriptional regulator, cysteine metabolism repressor